MSDNPRTKASAKYNKKMVKQYKFSFNRKTDSDIIEYLDSVENKQGLIKDLIRAKMTGTACAPVIEKKIIDGDFKEGEFVVVSIDGKEFRRKVWYSTKWGDLVITVLGNEYAYSEFN